jgi:CRP-like cAMP-binding protein
MDVTPANRLLDLLPLADKLALKRYLRPFTAPSRTVLHEPDQPLEHIYFPTDGMISLLTVMEDGRGIETATIGNEGAVGVEAALRIDVALTRAVVQLPLTALRISGRDFVRCVERRSVVRSLAHRAYEGLMSQIQQTAACNGIHKIESRLARWLLQSQDCITGSKLPLTQEFLAEMLAVRRTSVSEIANTLQTEGLLKYTRGAIEILDREGLRRKSCECYATLRRHTQRLLEKPLD